MSRDLTKLSPFMQEKVRLILSKFHEQNADRYTELIVVCTDRTGAEQAACFEAKLSNCKPGQSAHNAMDKLGYPASEAVDFGVIRSGKYVGNGKDSAYLLMGKIAEEVGLLWAGRWVGKIKEAAHCQNPSWKKPF